MSSFLNQQVRFRLRIYAITFKNKILAAYFGALAVTRLTVTLVASFVQPPTVVDLPPLPIDAFNLCGIVANLQFRMVPASIATAFGQYLWSFRLLAQSCKDR